MARILVVEDEDNIAMALEFLLARDGHAHSRLSQGGAALVAIRTERPDSAAVEEVLGNSNAQSTLKLGQARGVVLLAAATAGLHVGEYHPSTVKKAVVGTGGAEKRQIQAMMAVLLPGAKLAGPDAADALAVAITHAHHLASAQGMARRARVTA